MAATLAELGTAGGLARADFASARRSSLQYGFSGRFRNRRCNNDLDSVQSVFVPLKFFHFARNPFRDEASPVGVPLVEVVGAYPVGVRVTVLADIDRAGSFTAWRVVHVAAIVSHGSFLGDFANSIRELGQS